jgi:hypothetical protein
MAQGDREATERRGDEIEEATIWLLVDHSAREAAYNEVARLLGEEGHEVEVVTITEMIGQVARDALAGGAERLLRGLRVAVRGRTADEDLIGAVRRARPDLLAVTNARYVRALSLLESITGIPSLQLGIMSDFNFSARWTRSSLHAFIVPHEELRSRFVAEGVDGDRVLVAGPPIDAGFVESPSRQAAREEFGFGEESVVLVRAETFGAETLEKMIFQATMVERDVRFAFHHNGDGAVASTLRRAARDHRLQAVMFGRVDDLERYVAAADLVVASPGEPMLAEILAGGRPMVLVGRDPGYSEQVDFLERHGVARHVADVVRLGAEIERQLDDRALSEATEAAESIGLPSGSEEVAEAIAEALSHRDEWRHPATEVGGGPRPDGEGSGDEEPAGSGEEEESGGGAFESIGSDGRRSGGGGGGGESGDDEIPMGHISRAEAKEQLAALILAERDLERKLTELERQQDRWRNRLELAREWGEEDLASEAEGILRDFLEEAAPLERELADIHRQKEKLKRAARGDGRAASGAPPAGGEDAGRRSSRMAEIEGRFREMEMRSDLDDLKDRVRRELGED